MKNSWPTKKLGEVLELCDAGTWGEEDPNGMPLLRSSNMQNGHLILEDLKYIDVPENKKKYYTLISGDILVTKSSGSVDHIGKSLYITEEMDGKYGFSNFTQRLRANQKIVVPKWIYFKVSNPETRNSLLNASQTTTGLRNLKISFLKELEIPIPPLEIQKKIVKKIEELFAKIDQAQSLRESATQDANDLIPATLSKIFDEGKKEGWEEKALSGICEKTSNINWNEHKEEDFQYIDLSSVSREDFSIAKTQEVNFKNAPSRARKIINTYDVIFGTTRPTLMRVTIIPTEYNKHICSTGFAVLRAREGHVLPQFIYYFIRSEQFMDRMENIQTGASYPAVSDAKVLETKIPLPPIPEQKEIVERMDALTQKVRELQKLQSETAANLTALKQSILHQAFQGDV